LLELATKQHGVVSTRQLAEAGYGRNSASKANRVGRLRRIHRGVYAVGHEDLGWEGRCMAAVLACRPAVASHYSAGWLFGLLRARPRTIDVSTPTQRRPRRAFFVHTAPLASEDLDLVEGIPVAGLARTKLDLAEKLRPAGLEQVLERSEELGSFDLGSLEGVLGRYPRHPGAAALKRALEIYRPEPAFTRSKLEKQFLQLVREAGLSEPSMNFVVAGMELDAYWERERFCVELDVFETHGTQAAFERDRIRSDDLLAAGVESIRVTGPRLRREPDAVILRLQAHLRRRQALNP
jgi:very-short-patch-repair endonuclease